MKEEKTEGIVLRSQEFREKQRIITLFSREEGMISLIVKQISKTRSHLLGLTTPFCQGEFHYQRGRSELMLLQDGASIDEHLELRQKLAWIDAGSEILQAILRSQMPGKPAPALYALLSSYLKQIPSFSSSDTAVCTFLLKLLRHEGLLQTDAPYAELCLARSFSLLHPVELPAPAPTQIRMLFQHSISH